MLEPSRAPMLVPAELVWLLAAVAKGDQPAFERLYASTAAKLFGVVSRILPRDPAEEAMRETYREIWSTAARFVPGAADPLSWMVGVARRRALDLRRRMAAAPDDAADDASDSGPDQPAPEIGEELRRVLACMGRLDLDRRRLVLLAFYDGRSRTQLAACFDWPVATVQAALVRSLAEMRECLR
jgi:RNA polymerase sigma-70 factor (ECF subfamily)